MDPITLLILLVGVPYVYCSYKGISGNDPVLRVTLRYYGFLLVIWFLPDLVGGLLRSVKPDLSIFIAYALFGILAVCLAYAFANHFNQLVDMVFTLFKLTVLFVFLVFVKEQCLDTFHILNKYVKF